MTFHKEQSYEVNNTYIKFKKYLKMDIEKSLEDKIAEADLKIKDA